MVWALGNQVAQADRPALGDYERVIGGAAASTARPYGRRNYNPEKSALFYATY
jgi:hypothetical protein